MTRTRLAGILLILALAITSCGTARSAAPAAPQPPVIPGQANSGPDLAGAALPDFVMPLISGGVSLPKTALTPGAVTTTDATTVCNLAQHASPPSVPSTVKLAIDISYGYITSIEQNKYGFDFLVPYDLGGAPVQANIWPAAIRGTGFYQKLQTDARLREMVCRRTLTLAQAQHALEANWYAAWLRYVIAAGHI